MKAKSRWFWLLLSMPLLAGLAGVAWFFFPRPSVSTSSIFADAGYLTLRLTLDYHAPGSIYKVEDETDNLVNLHPTCEVNRDDIANAVQTYRTTDVSEEIERKLSAGYKVAPENWKKLNLAIDLQAVRDIKAVYANSTVEQLSTEKVQALRDSYLNRSGCFAAVKYDLDEGFQVCQTEAVIVSDLVYEVTYRAQGGPRMEGRVQGGVGVEGDIHVESGLTRRISGRKMYHAVKLHRSRVRNACILLNTTTADSGQPGRAATNVAARNPG